MGAEAAGRGCPEAEDSAETEQREGERRGKEAGPQGCEKGRTGALLAPHAPESAGTKRKRARCSPQPAAAAPGAYLRPTPRTLRGSRTLHPRSLSPCTCPQGTRARPQHSPHLPPAPRGSARAPRHIRSNPAGPRGSRTHTPEGHRPYAMRSPASPAGPSHTRLPRPTLTSRGHTPAPLSLAPSASRICSTFAGPHPPTRPPPTPGPTPLRPRRVPCPGVRRDPESPGHSHVAGAPLRRGCARDPGPRSRTRVEPPPLPLRVSPGSRAVSGPGPGDANLR